jgi:hypothetical protein
MAIGEDKTARLRKMLLPAAAGVIGAGAGLALTSKRRLRDAVPNLDQLGMGDLVDDLRGRLDSAMGRSNSSARTTQHLEADEYERRRREREQHRNQRRARR